MSQRIASFACRLVLVVGACASVPAPAMAQPAAADPARIERGRSAFVSKGCYECHGYVGQGSIISGPALAGLQIPFEGLDAYVRAPGGQMPPYSRRILSADELRDIQAFIASLPVPAKSP